MSSIIRLLQGDDNRIRRILFNKANTSEKIVSRLVSPPAILSNRLTIEDYPTCTTDEPS